MKNNHKESSNHRDYFSLEEATKFCNYSQGYLSLRARQGKLKALKFSNNWVTKEEWLQEYQKGVEDYNNQVKNKKLKKKTARASQSAPPANLPIKRLFEAKLSLKDVNPALRAVLVTVLITVGVFFALRQAQGNPELVEWIEKESLLESYHDLLPYIKNATQNVAEVSDDFFVAAVNHQDTLKLLSDVFGEYGQWVKDQALELLY